MCLCSLQYRRSFLALFVVALTGFCFPIQAQEFTLIPPNIEQLSNPISVLSNEDKDTYALIFFNLENQNYTQARESLDLVKDDVLKGVVLAQMYLAQDAPAPSKKELESWLKKYIDLPFAEEIYDKAVAMKAKVPPKKPTDPAAHMAAGSCTSMQIADPIDLVFYKNVTYVPEPKRQDVRKGMQYFSSAIRRGKTLAAQIHLNDKNVKKYISQKDKDDSLTALAFAYFIDRQDQKAWQTIQEPLLRSIDRNPLAPWVAGIVAWRMGKLQEAEQNFKQVAHHKKSPPELKARGAYWATRALILNGKYLEVTNYLHLAARSSPRSFYGILAQRALGWNLTHSWKIPDLAQVNQYAILATKGGRRAVALVQLEQMDLAQKELIKLYAEQKQLREDLVGFAQTIPQYPEIAVRLSGLTGALVTPDGDNALYPYPNWQPANGWKIDRALAYAFVRQESCFKNKAFSKAGARGVMQLMPQTARLMAKRLGKQYQLSRLHRIPYNLMMGQELIVSLLNYKAIDGNLLMAVASYNCGPRNTVRWQKRDDFVDDPLMFVEGIPSRETRGFVKKVMANYWIYRSLFNKDLSSIDDVLLGRYPIYRP